MDRQIFIGVSCCKALERGWRGWVERVGRHTVVMVVCVLGGFHKVTYFNVTESLTRLLYLSISLGHTN